METWNIDHGNVIEIKYELHKSFSIEQQSACISVGELDLSHFLQWLTDIEYCYADINQITLIECGTEIKSVRQSINEFELHFDSGLAGNQVIKINSDELDELCNNLA
jgi:hypothetical protein